MCLLSGSRSRHSPESDSDALRVSSSLSSSLNCNSQTAKKKNSYMPRAIHLVILMGAQCEACELEVRHGEGSLARVAWGLLVMTVFFDLDNLVLNFFKLAIALDLRGVQVKLMYFCFWYHGFENFPWSKPSASCLEQRKWMTSLQMGWIKQEVTRLTLKLSRNSFTSHKFDFHFDPVTNIAATWNRWFAASR